MHKHLQTFIHPHVEIDVAVRRTRIAVFQTAHIQRQGLLIQATLVEVGGVNFLVDARRDHVRHGLTNPVLFQVHRREGKLGSRGVVHFQFLQARKALLVAAPFPSHEFDAAKTQRHRLAPSLHEHPHESNGPEVADAVVCLLVLSDRNLELVPLDGALFSGTVGFGHRLKHIRQVPLAHVLRSQVRQRQRNLVLVVRLDGAQGQILVDVLRVGDGRRGDGVPVRLLRVGVALVTAEELVAFQNVLPVLLCHGVPEVAEIVGGRVVLVLGQRIRVEVGLQAVQPRSEEGALVLGVQAVEPHVLQTVVVGAVVKGVDHIERGRVGVHPPRAGVGLEFGVVRRGQPILKFELAVVQDVLADVAQVDVKLSSTLVLRILVEGVHHPKLDVLDVGRFKVGRGQGPLDARPTLVRVLQGAVGLQSGRVIGTLKRFVVVRAALGRPIRHVQRRQVGRHPCRGAVAVIALLVELAQQDLTHAVVLTDFRVHLTVLQRTSVHE